MNALKPEILHALNPNGVLVERYLSAVPERSATAGIEPPRTVGASRFDALPRRRGVFCASAARSRAPMRSNHRIHAVARRPPSVFGDNQLPQVRVERRGGGPDRNVHL